jgi:transcriptional regulator with XRE-family HTH domain
LAVLTSIDLVQHGVPSVPERRQTACHQEIARKSRVWRGWGHVLFTAERMSSPTDPELLALRLAAHAGMTIAGERRRRGWSLRDLATRSHVSIAAIHAIEHGRPAGLRTYAAIALALGLEPRMDLVDPRKRAASARAEDPVHAAMGEAIAARLSSHGFEVSIDEPFQHFQFAGRADILAWDRSSRSLLHVENRTRFPNVQEAFGSYNTKRRYLPAVIAERIGLRGGFASVSNVIAGLWSAEVFHTIRMRPASFRAVCPDDDDAFEAWWSGSPPAPGPATSAFILFDPIHPGGNRRRQFVALEEAIGTSVRPRFRGYAHAVDALRTTFSAP